MKKICIVLGLGYGDEGKGATVNALCRLYKDDAIVVRFSGGHQVGHTVVENDIRHTFSNFGSGTLLGVPTYWSEYCTVNPVAVQREGDALRALGINPKVIYNANAMVTTPIDIYKNLMDAKTIHNGTVGVGFGATVQRNEDLFHLYVRDLYYPKIRDYKIGMIFNYYLKDNDSFRNSIQLNDALIDFKNACDHLVNTYEVVDSYASAWLWNKNLIMEGSQGIMLDMDYGFFPHVTRSNTTSKNAIEFIKNNIIEDRYAINTYYVSRAYQTRHGNGPMINEGQFDISHIGINPNEPNVDTGKQGRFRKAVLDIPQLQYAVSCDTYHNSIGNKNLVLTCCDHVNGDNILATNEKGELRGYEPDEIGMKLGVLNTYISNSEKGILL